MTNNDDYLWDPAVEPDADVVRLEQMLAALRSTATAPPLPANVERRTSNHQRQERYLGIRFLAPGLAATAAIAVMVGLTSQNNPPASAAHATTRTASWAVSVLIGSPHIGSSIVVGDGRISVGQTLITDVGSRAKMEV